MSADMHACMHNRGLYRAIHMGIHMGVCIHVSDCVRSFLTILDRCRLPERSWCFAVEKLINFRDANINKGPGWKEAFSTTTVPFFVDTAPTSTPSFHTSQHVLHVDCYHFQPANSLLLTWEMEESHTSGRNGRLRAIIRQLSDAVTGLEF
jgi:hypothetical protein